MVTGFRVYRFWIQGGCVKVQEPSTEDVPATQLYPVAAVSAQTKAAREKFVRVYMLLRGIRGRLGVPWLVGQLQDPYMAY